MLYQTRQGCATALNVRVHAIAMRELGMHTRNCTLLGRTASILAGGAHMALIYRTHTWQHANQATAHGQEGLIWHRPSHTGIAGLADAGYVLTLLSTFVLSLSSSLVSICATINAPGCALFSLQGPDTLHDAIASIHRDMQLALAMFLCAMFLALQAVALYFLSASLGQLPILSLATCGVLILLLGGIAASVYRFAVLESLARFRIPRGGAISGLFGKTKKLRCESPCAAGLGFRASRVPKSAIASAKRTCGALPRTRLSRVVQRFVGAVVWPHEAPREKCEYYCL